MSGRNQNLTGRWDGTFSYPDVPEAGPTTPFVATLTDNSGVLKGEVIEPHEFREGSAHSTILGQRIGNSVHFSKSYHDAGWEYNETVLYFGTLSGDGDTIAGEWQIEHWRGPFEMVREGAEQVLAEQEAEAELEIEQT